MTIQYAQYKFYLRCMTAPLPTTAWTRGKAGLKTTTPDMKNVNFTVRVEIYSPYGVKTN